MLSGIIMAAVFLSLWIFAYLPGQLEAVRLNAELSDTQKQIRQIEGIMAEGRISGIGIGILKEKYRRLKEKFPEDEEEGVAALSTIARGCGMEVISSDAKPKMAFLDENQQPVTFEGKTLQVISVSIELKSTYKDLLKYIQALRVSLPVLATVETLSITNDEANPKQQNISLDINLYFS